MTELIPKGAQFIRYGMTRLDVECNCNYPDCTFTIINHVFLKKLHVIRRNRSANGGGLFFTNIFRCQRHNKDVGGSDNSMHKRGMAADIVGQLTEEEKKSFDFVKWYPDKNMTHVQINKR